MITIIFYLRYFINHSYFIWIDNKKTNMSTKDPLAYFCVRHRYWSAVKAIHVHGMPIFHKFWGQQSFVKIQARIFFKIGIHFGFKNNTFNWNLWKNRHFFYFFFFYRLSFFINYSSFYHNFDIRDQFGIHIVLTYHFLLKSSHIKDVSQNLWLFSSQQLKFILFKIDIKK